ncbi:HNH endonuclease [Escherichia coli]
MMKVNNQIKFNHIKKLWYLKDGVIYSRWGNKPVSFASKDKTGHRFTVIEVNGKRHHVSIHEAVFMFHYNRPIVEGKHIHHIDGNPKNNTISNLIELTPTQHSRIHNYQCDDPMRGIRLDRGAWKFEWYDDGNCRSRRFHGINEAMIFRAEIEEPRRAELRVIGLNCKRAGNRLTTATMRQINKRDRLRYRCRN